MAAGISPTPLSHTEVSKRLAQSVSNMNLLIDAYIRKNDYTDLLTCGCSTSYERIGGFKLKNRRKK
jgi:5'-methylthioadenosine phosphorylase